MTYFSNVEKFPLDYDTYRDTAMDCDILLWEPRNWYGEVVAIGTGGEFCHASLSCWLESRLWDLGFNELAGGAGRPLSGIIKANPGKASVFRLQGQFDSNEVKRFFIDHLHEPYNWAGVRRLSLLYLAGVRLIPAVRRYVEDHLQSSDGAFCSEAIHKAFICTQEVHLVRRASSLTTPNDLATSPNLIYLGTLQ